MLFHFPVSQRHHNMWRGMTFQTRHTAQVAFSQTRWERQKSCKSHRSSAHHPSHSLRRTRKVRVIGGPRGRQIGTHLPIMRHGGFQLQHAGRSVVEVDDVSNLIL